MTRKPRRAPRQERPRLRAAFCSVFGHDEASMLPWNPEHRTICLTCGVIKFNPGAPDVPNPSLPCVEETLDGRWIAIYDHHNRR